jgi:hypothetical protein
VALAAVAGGASVATANLGGTAHAANGSPPSTSTERVLRTDLAATENVSGSIGYDGSYTVVNPAGTSAQAVKQAQQALAQAQSALAADGTAATDTTAANTQSIAEAKAALAATQSSLSVDQAKQTTDCAGAAASSPACQQDGQKVTQDQAQILQQAGLLAGARLAAVRSSHQDQAKLATDNAAVQNAQAALTDAQRTAANPGTAFTWLPAAGQVVGRNQPLYAIDGKPVPLLFGTTAMWRDFELGMDDGPDVAELTANLIALGFGRGLTQGPHFSQATADAVKRWQVSLGLAAAGTIRLGEVQFAPAALRVSSLHAATGAAAAPGPVLDATSTVRIVTVPLTVDKESLVHAGDAVSILLPDGKTTTRGHVRDISSVATAPAGGGGGGGTPTVTVTVTLDDPGGTGNLDQAPVEVTITDQAVHGVLAVPINALLALAEGGDAVAVVTQGARHLVAVQTGLFSDTLVEVSGDGIVEGTVVEVPSS